MFALSHFSKKIIWSWGDLKYYLLNFGYLPGVAVVLQATNCETVVALVLDSTASSAAFGQLSCH